MHSVSLRFRFFLEIFELMRIDSGHEGVTQTLSEAQALQKSIRDMELELARIKANYPAGKVSSLSSLNFFEDKRKRPSLFAGLFLIKGKG